MTPVTRGRGNRFVCLEDVDNREELIREEQLAAFQAHSEAQFVSLREQINAFTKLMSNESGRFKCQHISLPYESEEEDTRVEDEDGNLFGERGVYRHQPLVQAQANQWESSFKLNIPKFRKGSSTQGILELDSGS
jgi:hypothetical protein